MTEWRARFQALGVEVAAIVYDDVSILADFSEAQNVVYPLLSDKGGKQASALGIRNEQYAQGHPAYGIAHPGIFFIDTDGFIRLKRALPDYRERPAFDELLDAVRALAEDEQQRRLEPTGAAIPGADG